jgi:hypothetical protein
MIINIRGTSGSGKSYAAKAVAALYGVARPVYVPGRRQPLYYLLPHPIAGRPSLQLVGHYEVSAGGCDNVKDLEWVFDIVAEGAQFGRDLLFEGLLVSGDFNRTLALYKAGYPITVIAMDTPLAACLDSVNARRRLKDPYSEPVNPFKTVCKYREVKRKMLQFRQEGLPALWLSRDQVLPYLIELLHL